jgi:beta-galactosidase
VEALRKETGIGREGRNQVNRRQFVLLSSTGAISLLLNKSLSAAPSVMQTASSPTRTPLPLFFGVDYYPDQTTEALWEQDAVAMAEVGITNVRIAEFAWSLMEPREGTFDFQWLKRAVDVLHKHGIAVILGTPSAAPPPWLSAKYPDVLLVNENGVTLSPSTRRFTCPTNFNYRRLANAVAAEMAKTFSSVPGVVGWQIDNELALGSAPRCFCRSCRVGFQQWLKAKYGSLGSLNREWGTVFWSNVYTDFSQVPVPLPSGAPPNPGFALDYDRYQSAANVSFMKEQLKLLRQLCPSHFVTTNNLGGFIDTIDMRDLYRDLDFVASDNYPGVFEVFASGDPNFSITPEASAAMVSFAHDFMRSVKDGKPFLIMEEQSGKAGQPTFSAQPAPGQLRLWSYQAIAHGAMGINYFRWDSARSGAEEYWHGMLNHDRTKSPGFDEIQQTIRELKSVGEQAFNAAYTAELALLYDYNSAWALAIQPGQPKLKYVSEIMTWYGGMAAAHAGIDVVDGNQDLSAYKVLCAPLMYIVSPEQAKRIRAFVEGGGVFITGIRLGVKDEASRIVETALPGLLSEVMGVEVIDYQPLYSAKQGVQFAGALAGPNAECRQWADILSPREGTEVLATYTVDHAGKAAITSHSFGKGKATYIGSHLEPSDLGRVLVTLLTPNGVTQSLSVPSGVEITVRHDGPQRWTYLLNHTSKAVDIPLKSTYRDVLSGTPVSGSVSLEPYGVKLLADS